MTPGEKVRQLIDARLEQSGWIVQDLCNVNPMASLGVAVREYPCLGHDSRESEPRLSIFNCKEMRSASSIRKQACCG